MLCYLFGEIEAAKRLCHEVKRYLTASPGTVCEPAFYFYESLMLLATLNSQF
jgi:predicted ATPase